ncbi:coiled-coil domain-containing protein 83 isoform X2 [Myripristis murdjan]|uniref:coiled-coil domain-containing protein 83 isoform X2 n=1 Tax=Myripristis murdjan TaxID=586833 RepID=UPI001175F8C9|nr:coiled-coil domain-containing protein 83 isoform X2 [Myripristis murdjan]
MGKKKAQKAQKAQKKEKDTVADAFMRLQIEEKKKEIERVQEEITELEKERQKYIEKIEQAKRTQQGPIRAMWKKYKEQQRTLDQMEEAYREEEEQAQKATQSEQAHLAELRRQLSHLDVQISDLEAEHQHRETSNRENQARSAKLEEKLVQMQKDCEEEAENIKRAHEMTLKEIDMETAKEIARERDLAIKEAIQNLSVDDKQKIEEHAFLQKEIAASSEEISELTLSIESLQEENLQHIKFLTEQHMEDTVLTKWNHPRTAPLHQAVPREMQRFASESPTSGRILEEDETDPSQSQMTDKLLLKFPKQKTMTVVGRAIPLAPPPSEDEDDEQDSCVTPAQGYLTTRMINKRFK